MLKPKKSIDGYLKYPLMWVMLLWAFTLPGHEVKVYNFLFSVISGKPVAELACAQEVINRSEEQKQANQAYLEAAPTSFVGKIKFQPLAFVLDGFSFTLSKSPYFSSVTGYSSVTGCMQRLLSGSILPNAP